MPTLLHIDSSPLGEASISRHLSSEFVQNWKAANPNGKVITRDLNASNLTTIDAAWIAAVYTPEESRTSTQNDRIALSDALIAELFAADEFVLGVPMHNFGIPSVLKLWIDQVSRVNKTFSYATGSPVGLLQHKQAHIFIASGGVYDAGAARASYNFVEPYLRTVFGFLGVTDTNFLAADGVSALTYGKIDRQSFLQPHIESIRSQFQPA